MFCWSVHLDGAPEGCIYAAVTVGRKVYAFGELCDGNRARVNVNVFNTVSLRWRKLTTGGGEERHPEVTSKRYTAVLIDGIVYIWGAYHNILYAFDVDTHRWSKPKSSGTVPNNLGFNFACVLGIVMYVYLELIYSTDMYKLDTSTMVWSLINTGRSLSLLSLGNSATIIGTKIYVFGGFTSYHYNVFDTETNHWLRTPYGYNLQVIPSAFAYNGDLYICRGRKTNDMWKLNPETSTWKKVQTKGNGPSKMHWMFCCMVGDRIVCGGRRGLYILDLSPSLKTLCKLAVYQYGLDMSELPHNIRWELGWRP